MTSTRDTSTSVNPASWSSSAMAPSAASANGPGTLGFGGSRWPSSMSGAVGIVAHGLRSCRSQTATAACPPDVGTLPPSAGGHLPRLASLDAQLLRVSGAHPQQVIPRPSVPRPRPCPCPWPLTRSAQLAAQELAGGATRHRRHRLKALGHLERRQ